MEAQIINTNLVWLNYSGFLFLSRTQEPRGAKKQYSKKLVTKLKILSIEIQFHHSWKFFLWRRFQNPRSLQRHRNEWNSPKQIAQIPRVLRFVLLTIRLRFDLCALLLPIPLALALAFVDFVRFFLWFVAMFRFRFLHVVFSGFLCVYYSKFIFVICLFCFCVWFLLRFLALFSKSDRLETRTWKYDAFDSDFMLSSNSI